MNTTWKKYYSSVRSATCGSQLLDLHINDRVIYDDRNYKILSITGNKGGKMVNVDMLGNVIGKTIDYTIIKQNDDWGSKKIVNFYWGIARNQPYGKYEKVLFLRSGILQYDHGPQITNINSHYLKYKTIPTTQEKVEPEVGMMVTVKIYEDGYRDSVREYAINSLIPNHTSMKYVGLNNRPILGNYDFEKLIWIQQLRNGYNREGKYYYEIVKIGGFGESDYTYNPY